MKRTFDEINQEEPSKPAFRGKSLLPPRGGSFHNRNEESSTPLNVQKSNSTLRIIKKPSMMVKVVEEQLVDENTNINNNSSHVSTLSNETKKENQSMVDKNNIVNIPINLVLHPLISKPSYIIKDTTTGVKVQYFERFLHTHFASILFKKFNESIELFTKDQLVIHGKNVEAPRKTLSYSDSNVVYSYSGMHRSSIPWFPELLKLRNLIQEKTCETFNYALVNVYENGDDYIGWHADKTKDLVENSSIVSLTLGEARPFQFKPSNNKQQTSEKSIITKYLPNGSMIIMNWNTQFHYKHCLPKRKNISKRRINITFRHVKT